MKIKAKTLWTCDKGLYWKSGGPGETLQGVPVRNKVRVIPWDHVSRAKRIHKAAEAICIRLRNQYATPEDIARAAARALVR